MKKYFILFIVLLPGLVYAQEKPATLAPEKPKWYDEGKIYGFFQGNMIYVTNSVYSWGNPTNNYLSSPQLAINDSVGHPALGFTAQHSRFGYDIIKGDKVKVGGKLEIDFYGGSHFANVKPRIRLGYASLSKGGFEIRFGQQWDLFSPHFATTNNTNGNLWYAGNMGFRRTQLQLIYKIANDKIAPMIQVSAGEATSEETGLGADNLSVMPMLQGRLSAKIIKKFDIGFYFMNASFRPNPDTTSKDFSASGFGCDISLPFHNYFELKGEFNTGTNLNNANLFTIAGNGAKDADKTNMGIWFNVTSKLHKHFQLVIGYGIDNNTTKDLVKGKIESNTVIYGDLIFPISDGYSLALEVQNINTKIKDGKNNIATVINLAGKINF
ncbi:MAG: hypothetical protein A2046_16795 [Bacteroidetes bacterium GWA2_30_7]|nr:MAG: hypothetical protein A2046_16795 [Bacteroidetes bacterium GWA2_30_7]